MTQADECRMVWYGPVSRFLEDTSRYIDLEGAFRSGKTTAALWKVFNSCIEHPGINWLICRYSDDDTQSKLKPPWREVCAAAGVMVEWDATEHCDKFPNGSKVYILGLKAQDQTSRYSKLRGMTLAGIYNDQSEELPYDVYLELKGRMSQSGHPHQLVLTPNPPEETHWLAREFPEDQHNLNHRYYRVSIYDNAHNLPAETIAGLEEAYPVGHVKHRSAVLGQRGMNVIGEPVYAAAFDRRIHELALTMNPHLPVYEAIDFGKHHPCVVWMQTTPYGGVRYLGGILGQDLFLEDFAPIILRYRSEWFADALEFLTCCDPAGSHDNSQGVRENGVKVLQDHGFSPRYKRDSNAPDVRLAMVERIAGHMRRRTPQGEALGVNRNHWLRIGPTSVDTFRFVADAFEAGYVWDEHFVSVGSKQIRKPCKDGWYEHGMNCCEYLELNFGGMAPSVAQQERQAIARQTRLLRASQRDFEPTDRAYRRSQVAGRAGL